MRPGEIAVVAVIAPCWLFLALWFHRRLPKGLTERIDNKLGRPDDEELPPVPLDEQQAAFNRVLTHDDDHPPAEPQSASPADHEAIQRMRDRWAKEAQS